MLSSALSRFNANLGNDAASTTKSTPQKALFGITPVTFVGRRECIAASDDDGAECAVAINSITKSGRKVLSLCQVHNPSEFLRVLTFICF